MALYRFEYIVTAKTASSLARSYLWKIYGGYIISSMMVAVISILLLIVSTYQAFWGACLGIVLTHWFYWYYTIKDSGKAVEAPKKVNVTIDDNGISFETEDTKAWAAWSTIKILCHYKAGLQLEKNGISLPVIPREYVTQDVIDYIEENVTKVGGIIR